MEKEGVTEGVKKEKVNNILGKVQLNEKNGKILEKTETKRVYVIILLNYKPLEEETTGGGRRVIKL